MPVVPAPFIILFTYKLKWKVYLEPGLEAFVGKRADTVISLAKGIIRQDPAAKIILGGDLNG